MLPTFESTMLFKNYRDNCEKGSCSVSHKHCKTLLVKFKIISLHIYKDLILNESKESYDNYN